MSPTARLDPMTTPTRDARPRRWALAFLAAVLAVAVGLFGAGPASAATTPAAQNAVGASTSAGQVVVGASASISAGQRLGNDPPRSGIVVATGVAAVNPVAPRALPLGRPVGGSRSQNAFVQERIAALQESGATRIRVNQQQVDINGTRVGVNRPDLQYTLNSQRYYEEFDVPLSKRGPGHEARILSNDPNGIVNLFTVK